MLPASLMMKIRRHHRTSSPRRRHTMQSSILRMRTRRTREGKCRQQFVARCDYCASFGLSTIAAAVKLLVAGHASSVAEVHHVAACPSLRSCRYCLVISRVVQKKIFKNVVVLRSPPPRTVVGPPPSARGISGSIYSCWLAVRYYTAARHNNEQQQQISSFLLLLVLALPPTAKQKPATPRSC